jgi:homoserine kinase
VNSIGIESGLVAGRNEAAPTGEDILQLRLPATSANLGPGFDAIALALKLALRIDAKRSAEFSLKATGRNPDICSALRRNLMLDVYEKTLNANVKEVIPLALDIHNEIPIGMGCGSSAAVRLAGLALANHFGRLGWGGEEILNEASRLEGHPDNAAACWLGGLTVATTDGGQVRALRITPAASWRALLVMPNQPLATTAARSVLPRSYDREDAVFNIQRSCLLTAAFATGRGDLLATAMQDRLHQPFRGEICPLLPRLEGLAGRHGILGVALSGAGPSVLLLIEEGRPMEDLRAFVSSYLSDCGEIEILGTEIELSAAVVASPVVDGVRK